VERILGCSDEENAADSAASKDNKKIPSTSTVVIIGPESPFFFPFANVPPYNFFFFFNDRQNLGEKKMKGFPRVIHLLTTVVGVQGLGIHRDLASLRSTYDYVIAGGGLTGLVVASRLSEDPNSE